VRRQIRKQMRVFVAIVCLLVGSLALVAFLLSQQRFYLPGWVPVIGTNFYEVKADLPTAQAVVPGQGQSVNIAGVKIGEVGDVELQNGHAVVTMQIFDDHKPIYRDASVLMRPKTGLKDMYLALDPGTKQAGELPEGGHVKVANTLPDVNADEVLAQLDQDTRAYLEILLSAGGTAFDDHATGADKKFQQTAEQDLREVFKRFEPTAKYGEQISSQLIARRKNITHVIHNFQELSTALAKRDQQLAAFVDSSNKNFQTFADEEGSLREALREFPSTLSQTTTTLSKTEKLAAQLGPALSRLRPFARNLAPALRKTRPFLRETTPIIRTQIRPFARDVQPTVRDLRKATEKLAPATPRLTRSFKVLNKFFNTLAYDPPGATQPFLFWSAWSAHNGATLWANQDAHGPVRRGIVLVGCSTLGSLLNAVAPGSPQLGTAVQLLNLPPVKTICPNTYITPGNEVP
jgi:phospholipid/cholesterol/gamma-HCH transport system substrate-binding protein